MVTRNCYRQAMMQRARGRLSVSAQSGFLTISVMILLFVTAALLTLYVERQSERSRLERGEQLGYALSVLGAGFNMYLDAHHVQLAQADPRVPGVKNALQPTAEDVIRLANIRGVAPKPPSNADGAYRFQVSYPSGCTPKQKLSDTACRPVGLAYIDEPVTRGEKVDYLILARAVRVMQGRGGFSLPERPAYFAFPDGPASTASVSVANPVGRPGILAWRADTLHADRERLLVHGGNRMHTTLRLDGAGRNHDLEGAANITGSGDLKLGGDGRVQGNIFVGRGAEIKGVTKVDDLNFSTVRVPGAPCKNLNSIGIARSGDILYCDFRKKWAFPEERQRPDISYKQFDAPTGFLQEMVNYYYSLGNWIYCRNVVGSSTLWYADHVWNVSVSGNSGWHQIMCFGELN